VSLVLVLGLGCAGKNADVGEPSGVRNIPIAHNDIVREADGEPASAEEVVVSYEVPPAEIPVTQAEEAYRIGEEDVVAISVYAEADLSVEQAVRPDGMIAFPLVGDVRASGLTPDELRTDIETLLSRFVRTPRATVVVTEYNSRKVIALGEVRNPGTQKFAASVNLLEGIAQAGGVTENADLRRALLVRNGEVLPINFESLLRRADLSQNVPLQPEDVILVPDVSDKKIFVLGEVRDPMVINPRHDIDLIEAITMAGGFTDEAKSSEIFIVRGGLSEPELLGVDAQAVLRKGEVANNLVLQSGDIVFVPETGIASVAAFFRDLRDILTPVVLTYILARDLPGAVVIQ
jgi:polysaccharide export outer membrane protein